MSESLTDGECGREEAERSERWREFEIGSEAAQKFVTGKTGWIVGEDELWRRGFKCTDVCGGSVCVRE